MLLSFVLARLNRSARYTWKPSLDLADRGVFAALIPGTQY